MVISKQQYQVTSKVAVRNVKTGEIQVVEKTENIEAFTELGAEKILDNLWFFDPAFGDGITRKWTKVK